MSSKTKNKKEEEIQKKRRHLQTQNKRKQPAFLIDENSEIVPKRILIVSEGKNTEPSYFKQFRVEAAKVITIGGVGETIRVVERAEIESKKANFDEVWVVFDKDDFPADNFDNAISKAESLGFQVAFSNQAFEYWLILHFENHQGGAMHRNDYDAKINQHLLPFEIKYDGENSKIVDEQFFEILNAIDTKTGEKRVVSAIKRAKSIFENIETTSFAAAESSTTVFKLVEELMQFS
jgi:hypothetical protein